MRVSKSRMTFYKCLIMYDKAVEAPRCGALYMMIIGRTFLSYSSKAEKGCTLRARTHRSGERSMVNVSVVQTDRYPHIDEL